ncbi:response regulator transcription factor [Peterkaempfera bronchialis]|nr:LuxR C-terminal-related transcriptional regulator [Peterkaempfera bronchialis]
MPTRACSGASRAEAATARRAPGALRERPWWSRRIARARPDEGYGALRAGASGFLAALRVVAAGEALIAPSVTRRLIEEFAARPEPAAAPRHGVVEGIADREREVLVLVGRGRSSGEIASGLFIGPATAKAHGGRLPTKSAARDRVQLVTIAFELGLVPTSRRASAYAVSRRPPPTARGLGGG